MLGESLANGLGTLDMPPWGKIVPVALFPASPWLWLRPR